MVIFTIRLLMKKYPAIIEAMEHRHELYKKQLEEIRAMEESGKGLVIRPPEPLGIGRTEKNPDRLERVYRCGRRESEKRLDEVRRFITSL